MTLLPAVIPEIPEARAGIVPARLARKVGPLFGIQWDRSPFGLTWVSDYTKLTLSEIARGAPVPARSDAADVEPLIDSGQWQIVNRAVVTRRPAGALKPEPLPNEIANATLNRFGPDTKAAVILAAANTLLEPASAAIVAALGFLEQTPVGLLPARMRVAAWAALVLEAFRSQPALFAAAVQAREIQRAVLLGWHIPSTVERTCARVEIGGSEQERPIAGSPSSPVDLEVVDRTVEAVLLVDPAAAEDNLARVRTEGLRRELTRRWLSRLVALGTEPGEGLLWLAEHDGHRVVEAFAPHDPTLWSFLTEIASLLPVGSSSALGPSDLGTASLATAMPAIPPPADLSGLALLTRRAVVVALTTLVRLAFNSGNPDPAGDLHTLQTLEQLAELARQALPADDPVAAVTTCRVADMRLELVRQDAAHDAKLGSAVDDLLVELARCLSLAERRILNNSDAAELVRSGSVELMVLLRRHTPEQLISGVPSPAQLLDELDRLWKTMLRLMQIDIEHLHEQPPVIQRLVGYQLHDYVTYLGGNGSAADARTAVQLYRDFVVPARVDYYRLTGFFQPLLYTYQNATRSTTRLAELAGASGNLAEAREYAQQGRAWIAQALQEPYTVDMLERALGEVTDEVCRFALLAVPALLASVTYAPSSFDAVDLNECERLLEHARRFAERFAKGGGEYARAGELVQLNGRLEAIRTGREGSH